MSSDKDGFEERLRRISEARSQALSPVAAGSGHAQPSGPQPRRLGPWMPVFLLSGVLSAGIATLLRATFSEGPQAILLQAEADQNGADSSATEPGLINRLSGMVFASASDQPRGPADFLPAAPDGWVRVTPKDAALPDALDAVKARWPQGSSIVPLEQNLGYTQLEQYLKLRGEPDAEQHDQSKTGASAIYLNGNGEFLSVELRLTPERSALGARNDPASWIDGLLVIEEKSLDSGEELERLQLSGMDVTNQTKPAGKSLIARPIESDIHSPNGMKIAVPLTSRAILRIQGISTPIAAQTLMTSIDRDELSALDN